MHRASLASGHRLAGWPSWRSWQAGGGRGHEGGKGGQQDVCTCVFGRAGVRSVSREGNRSAVVRRAKRVGQKVRQEQEASQPASASAVRMGWARWAMGSMGTHH